MESASTSNASHTYTVAGAYTVTLTISGPAGGDIHVCRGCVLAVQGAEAEVSPQTGGTLSYSSGPGSETALQVPGGAVTQTTTLLYAPLANISGPPGGFRFAGLAFDLTAYQANAAQAGFRFAAPVTVTLRYTSAQVQDTSVTTLELTYWDAAASAWQDAACGPYDRHPTENWLAVPICHLSRFGSWGSRRRSTCRCWGGAEPAAAIRTRQRAAAGASPGAANFDIARYAFRLLG